ncbi:MAG: hypothetical protein GX638_15070 [Crenarchaeota archaeon]|nr:hypothetical protein [Thermoproteota archaeon]
MQDKLYLNNNYMKNFILIFFLFMGISLLFAQKITFEEEASKYFDIKNISLRFDERGGRDVMGADTFQNVMESEIMRKLLPVIDSVESYWGFMGNYKIQQVAFPLMKNLKCLALEGLKKYNIIEPYHFSSKLQYLRYENEAFQFPFEFKELANSLQVLNMKLLGTNVKEPFHFDFSSFDSLRCLRLTMNSCRSSDYYILFPPNLYCLEWTVNSKHPDIPIPSTVEILFLHMENNSYPPMLFKLPNLRFFSNANANYRNFPNISLPKELITISSLKVLEVDRLTKRDIEIISQMENLDSLYVNNVRRIIPPNVDKLKGLKYIELNSYPSKRARIVGKKLRKIISGVTVRWW